MPKKSEDSSVNIYDLLSEVSEEKEEKKSRRAELLESMDVTDRFEEGSITIDMRTCRGIECNLCVKACPTNALYWKAGEIGIEEDLCIHCTACVLSCCVDDCIRVTRKRPDGKTESFSKPTDVLKLNRNKISKKKREAVKSILENPEEYYTSQE
ncbi:MAG: 4Fe-4S binding protein [Candidatus Bathyarchaeota archaeon]